MQTNLARARHRLFLDLEFSSDNLEVGRIIQIGYALTDRRWGFDPGRLRDILIRPRSIAVRLAPEDETHVSDACRKLNTTQLAASLESPYAVTIEAADMQICAEIERVIGPTARVIHTGYGLRMDVVYLQRYMPGLWAKLHPAEDFDLKAITNMVRDIHTSIDQSSTFLRYIHDAEEDVKDYMSLFSYHAGLQQAFYRQEEDSARRRRETSHYNYIPVCNFSPLGHLRPADIVRQAQPYQPRPHAHPHLSTYRSPPTPYQNHHHHPQLVLSPPPLESLGVLEEDRAAEGGPVLPLE